MHMLRHRSLRYQLITAALLPLAAVTATVLINVWLMFLSPHDSSVILIALATAFLLAVLGAWLVMRQIARGSAELGAAVERLVEDSTSVGAPVVPDGASVTQIPEELATVLADLDATRRTLAETRSRQRAAEDARRELVSFMSHDLRTPLAGLRALLEGLEDGVITDVPGALGHMRATVDRMSHLVDDLFELSRVQGSPRPRPETLVSLSELIIDVSTESAAVARAHNVALDAQVPSEDRLAVVGLGRRPGPGGDEPCRQCGPAHRLRADRQADRWPGRGRPRTRRGRRRLRRDSRGESGPGLRCRLARKRLALG